MEQPPLIGVEAAAFIGASVTLILVIVFMILMVILVRQCLQYLAKRNVIREQELQQSQVRQQVQQRRRLSVTEPVPATFDWHHSIRVEGTPPPTYIEAEKLPTLEKDKNNSIEKDDSIDGNMDNKLIQDTKITNTGMTPLISNGFEDNRSNSVGGREVVEVAITVEPGVQSPRSTGVASPQSHGSQGHGVTGARTESPDGDMEFSTSYTQYVAP